MHQIQMKEVRRAAALVYGPELHHLDHLAPISNLLGIPLIVTEEELSELAHQFYPSFEVLLYDYQQLGQSLVQNYEVIFTTLPRDLFEEIFFFAQRFLHKRLHTIWSPHGNSDKGHLTPFIEGLKKEEIALVYGKKMLDFLKQKGAFDQLKSYVITGNFRYSFYQRERAFYKKILTQRFSLGQKGRVFLYAPTWEDSEKSSSFFEALPHLATHLSQEDTLIVKPHPHLFHNFKTEQMILDYEERENVIFLKHFPPVYPLLDICDVYIGDMSSIGYDFLAFDRPMFFLNQGRRDPKTDPGLYLYRCGVEIRPERYGDIFKIIDFHLPTDKEDFSKIRKEVYDYTFGSEKKWEDLRKEIFRSFAFFPDPELDFL
jgi:teichoic acid glycerol-phosphate primase